MIFNRKIEILFEKDVQLILDGHSKICNWLYNHLLESVNKEYELKQEKSTLLKGRNLRDQVPLLKAPHPFLLDGIIDNLKFHLQAMLLKK